MDIKKFKDEYKNIYSCSLFLTEERTLYKKEPAVAKDYDKWLDRQLLFLDAEGLDVLYKRPSIFEKLSGTSVDLYCIRKKTDNKNPRVIFFAIIESEEEPAFVLLTAFHELSRGDYNRAINLAVDRQKLILKKLEEDGASS